MICRKRNCNVGVFVGLLSLCPGDRELTGTDRERTRRRICSVLKFNLLIRDDI